MRNFWRPLLLLTLVLIVPIVPFLLGADAIESRIEGWMKQRSGGWEVAGFIAGLLACDVFLPIPSSMITTYGGAQLGWLWGSMAAWIGMNCGATFGYYLARRWGRGIALWLSGETELARTQNAIDRWGTFVLVIARGVPVLAEATVLLFGMHHLPWRKFLPALLLSNLGVSVAYAALGDWAQRHSWLPTAMAISLALPILIAAAVQRHLSSLQGRSRVT